jgi:phage gpG-like protein
MAKAHSASDTIHEPAGLFEDTRRSHYRVGTQASKPGEYPRWLTGHLARSIAHEVNPETITVRVGTNVPYGKWLELGTHNMAPRPWMTLGLQEFAGEIQALLGGRAQIGEVQTNEE